MANFTKDSSGSDINYGMNFIFDQQGNVTGLNTDVLNTFLYGAGQNQKLGKVDLAAWDMATSCASCHVGGGMVEKDRNGVRLSVRSLFDMSVNPYINYVREAWDPKTGMPAHSVERAPWMIPATTDNRMPDGTNEIIPANFAGMGLLGSYDPKLSFNGYSTTMHLGWGSQRMGYGIKDGQLLIPNVRENDCLFCHLPGYNNLMSSVMLQGGMLMMAPAAGAGFMDLNPASPNMGNYNIADPANPMTANALLTKDSNGFLYLSGSRIQAKPATANCQQCHSSNSLKDLPDMMGGFLSSAPTVYNPASPMAGPTGMVMPAYDFNSPWFPAGSTSPLVTKQNFMNNMVKGMFAASGATVYDGGSVDANFIGGGNPGGSGPIYFEALNGDGTPDQNALKKATIPFPRADWFKRGDAWQAGQDVHGNFGCAGCHMSTNSTKADKNQCDPGRGYDGAGGIEDASGPIAADGTPTHKVDTRNTVKRCEHCHITGKNDDGVAIETFGARNPTTKHEYYGLKKQIVTALGQNNQEIAGDHLDVIDCTVCHVKKVSMSVRSLDCTSGNRYPTMEGFDFSKGMMGMFEDPAPDAVNDYARGQINQMYAAVNAAYGLSEGMPGYMAPIPSGTHVVGGPLKEWKPLRYWQKLGNGPKTAANHRQKVYLSNSIVSAFWNNTDGAVDANGDGVPAKILDAATYPGATKDGSQGFGETIFDPWVARDLKAGMNFGPGGFAAIPVGFGGAEFMSAFDAQGKFTGAFKYVGVYGGNVILTTPEEITAYKNYREAIKDAVDGKSWAGTELAYIGGPYMVTHGVKPPEQYVLGRSCADCHGEGKGFFDGGFNMTGSAIPAGATFNPTSVNPATNRVEFPGVPGLEGPSTVMERPAVYIPEIKAKKGDLRTGSELYNKQGFPRDVKFEKHVKADGTEVAEGDESYDFVVTKDLDRGEALYPDEKGVDSFPGYFKASDTAKANPLTRGEWLTYLKNIGAPAKAVIATIDGVASTGGTSSITVTADTDVALAADTTGNGPDSTYTWKIRDGVDGATRTLSGATVTTRFLKVGAFNMVLSVANPAGTAKTDNQIINVKAKPITPPNITSSFVNSGRTTTITFGNLSSLPAYDKAIVSWGDGTSTTLASLGDTVDHVYKRLARAFRADTALSGGAGGTGDSVIIGSGPGTYSYTTKVSFFSGRKRVALVTVPVTCGPASNLVVKARMPRVSYGGVYSVAKGARSLVLLTVTNSGPDTQTNVQLTVPALPAELTVLSSVAGTGTFENGVWNIGTMAKGKVATLTFMVTVPADAGVESSYTVPADALVSDLPDLVPNTPVTLRLKTK